jgi:hypothetical protein
MPSPGVRIISAFCPSSVSVFDRGFLPPRPQILDAGSRLHYRQATPDGFEHDGPFGIGVRLRHTRANGKAGPGDLKRHRGASNDLALLEEILDAFSIGADQVTGLVRCMPAGECPAGECAPFT